MKAFDKDGNEIDVFSKEEVEAANKKAVEEYVAANPDKSGDLTAAQKKITDLETKIAEGGSLPEEQKKRLIEARDTAIKERDTIMTGLGQQVKDLSESITGGHKKRALDALAGTDKDKREKIEAKFASLMKTGDYKNDEDGIRSAMSEAATIIEGKRPAPNFMDNITGGPRGERQTHPVAGQETAESTALRKNLGITDEDVKKYGGEQK